ncbi:hypothetical protein I6F09_18075 [Bradyrhizobium sp. IC3195]|uniref:hypothetical protein n=1 Tax=Bradyrhizobium sp. IC3195 TaxID=2793804 RepID=UPI001CD55E79|nr:hypothetical protein [Bradyrhizobium sp. IC3195]MCA1469803.1 hypothetical protein [Bradyrhizobium sp. IC3195]
MPETVTVGGPPVVEPVPPARSRKPATVSASVPAAHLDCSRTYPDKLEAEGVIQRQSDGFPLDQSRVAYLRHLRRERQQSSRSEADEVDALIDQRAGITLTHVSGTAARCSRDMQVRRTIDAVVLQIRRELAEAALAKADEWESRRSAGRTEGSGVRALDRSVVVAA